MPDWLSLWQISHSWVTPFTQLSKLSRNPRQMGSTRENGKRWGENGQSVVWKVAAMHYQFFSIPEVCNEWSSGWEPCNLHMAGCKLDSPIPYLICDVARLVGMTEFFTSCLIIYGILWKWISLKQDHSLKYGRGRTVLRRAFLAWIPKEQQSC